ncbi:MAG: hypothetical protein J6W89_03815 [Paludibacteraceae bacterium]|nr:hypothetical protein [Paludibacteraceae bacterium]
MKRIQVAKFARWLFHLHYDIRTEGGELLRDGRVHLILPATSADDSRTKSARVSSRTRIRVRTRACA